MTKLKFIGKGATLAILRYGIEIDLPPLTGSEEQIALATRIRDDLLEEIDNDWNKHAQRRPEFSFGSIFRNNPREMAFIEERLALMNNELKPRKIVGRIETIFSQTSAAWWIDHQHKGPWTTWQL